MFLFLGRLTTEYISGVVVADQCSVQGVKFLFFPSFRSHSYFLLFFEKTSYFSFVLVHAVRKTFMLVNKKI